MTERLSHKRESLYKDKITCSKTHLFVLDFVSERSERNGYNNENNKKSGKEKDCAGVNASIAGRVLLLCGG